MNPRSGGIEPIAAKDPAHHMRSAGVPVFGAAACAERECTPNIVEVQVARTGACADVPGPGAVTHVAGQGRLVELESAAIVAERSLVFGVAERDSGQHLIGNLHV